MQRRNFLSGAAAATIFSTNLKASERAADAGRGQPLLTEPGPHPQRLGSPV